MTIHIVRTHQEGDAEKIEIFSTFELNDHPGYSL